MTEASSLSGGEPRRKRKREPATERVGERVAEYRKDRDLKVSELARMVDVSPSLISQIERGQSHPSVSTLFALAEALEVPVDGFFTRDDQHDGSTASSRSSDYTPAQPNGGSTEPDQARYLVRGDAREALDIEGGIRWERLTPEMLPEVDFLELVYEPGATSNPELYMHPGTEMVLVLSGRFEILVGFERYELAPGDSIHFPSVFPHRYINPSKDEVARAVTVIWHGGVRRHDEGKQARP